MQLEVIRFNNQYYCVFYMYVHVSIDCCINNNFNRSHVPNDVHVHLFITTPLKYFTIWMPLTAYFRVNNLSHSTCTYFWCTVNALPDWMNLFQWHTKLISYCLNHFLNVSITFSCVHPFWSTVTFYDIALTVLLKTLAQLMKNIRLIDSVMKPCM